MLLGHSKGGVDAAAALSMYWSDLKDKVAGLALVQSPYGGSPIASDILREGQVAYKEARRIMEFIICKIIKGDMRSLEDLTYEKRREFISKHRLPVEQVPLVSFHTEARVAPGVVATMSQIAHAELPWLPLPRFLYGGDEFASGKSGREVPVVIPVAAAMAVCALHLKLRYGEASDGLVTRRDAEVPGSVVVRLERKLDHAWMVYSSQKKNQLEADASDMCEALLTMLVEIGRRKQGEDPKMVKFLKPNKAVIVLQGRFAGRKAVIVRAFDDGTRERPYGHCLVAGVAKYPKKVIRKDSAKKTAKKSRVKAFLKLVNYSHIMPTRYTLDVDLKDVVTVDALQSRDKKVSACKETKARLEERFKTGKNRWFFTKLRF
ncbi:hypothetical protein GW17_00054295 [Ensete ventricosum]|uniref:60S ribosomal protein L27 n=2 Tax=Ensete ventricosum TaxID=4639 RepID=A0A427A9S2_ENSVE|nr:hypothetical protein B296_00007382 [Ensete ventricosum]RWV84028.1 hypothetical protein GW17_00054295 [Ensete ventricosum]